jgi:hypothetical protein
MGKQPGMSDSIEVMLRLRRANTLIAAMARRLGVRDDVGFICECADESCLGTVRLSLAEFSDLREEQLHFVVMPNHDGRCGGAAQAVRSGLTYQLVEATGSAAAIARLLDPGRRNGKSLTAAA